MKLIIPGSSMVEQEAVNFEVTGSSPVRGAIFRKMPSGYFLFYDFNWMLKARRQARCQNC